MSTASPPLVIKREILPVARHLSDDLRGSLGIPQGRLCIEAASTPEWEAIINEEYEIHRRNSIPSLK